MFIPTIAYCPSCKRIRDVIPLGTAVILSSTDTQKQEYVLDHHEHPKGGLCRLAFTKVVFIGDYKF